MQIEEPLINLQAHDVQPACIDHALYIAVFAVCEFLSFRP